MILISNKSCTKDINNRRISRTTPNILNTFTKVASKSMGKVRDEHIPREQGFTTASKKTDHIDNVNQKHRI